MADLDALQAELAALRATVTALQAGPNVASLQAQLAALQGQIGAQAEAHVNLPQVNEGFRPIRLEPFKPNLPGHSWKAYKITVSCVPLINGRALLRLASKRKLSSN